MADSREFRSKFYLTNLIFLALVLGVLVLVNATSNRASRFRLDLSADQIYSLSPSTVKILEKLKDQIKVTYYASENLDDFIGTLRRDTLDLFEELYRVSDGKFEYKVVDPERQIESESLAKVDAYMKLYSEKKFTELEEPEVQDIFAMLQGAQQPSAEERRKQREELASQLAARTKRNQNEVYRELLTAEWKEKLENELAQQGVQALVGRQQKADAVSQFKTYSSIKIEYLNKEAEVIPRHASIEGLEYELANRIVKLTTDVKPTVAFFDSRKADVPSPSPFTNAPPPRSDYAAIVDHLRNLFDVREIALTEGDSIEDLIRRLRGEQKRREQEARGEKPSYDDDDGPVAPEDFSLLKCLIVAQPDKLEERQVYEINRAVSNGVKTVFLVSPYTLDPTERPWPIEQLDTTRIDAMLRAWGVQLGDEILASNLCGTGTGTTRQLGGIPMRMTVPLPPIVGTQADAIDSSSPFTNKISGLRFPATTGLRIDEEAIKKAGLELKKLASTTDETWAVAINPFDRMRSPFGGQQPPGMSIDQYFKDLAEPRDPATGDFLAAALPLAVELSGKFPFIYEGEPVPAWQKKETESGDLPMGHPPIVDRDALPDLEDPTQADEPGDGEPAAAAGTAGAESASAAASPESEDGASDAADGATPTPVTANDGDSAPSPAVEVSTEDSVKAASSETAHIEPKDGRVLIVSSADFLKTAFLQFWRDHPPYMQNVDLIQNVIELYGLEDGELLVDIRRKVRTTSSFEKDSQSKADWIQAINLAGLPLLVALIGFLRFYTRRRASVRYEREYLRSQGMET